MRSKSPKKMTLDNPYALSLVFAVGGIIGFAIFELVLDGVCFDQIFAVTFIVATSLVIAFLVYWGSILEKTNFQIKKLPALFLIALAVIKFYISFQLIQSGAVDNPDLRLQSYGTSTLIMLSGAAGILFFPIGYFASPTPFVKKVVLSTVIITTVIDLSVGPSKSAVFGLGFTVLLFIFLRRKQTGESFPFPLIGKFSLVMLSVLLTLQIILGVFFYGNTPSEFIFILVNRAMYNFDGAIYGCMVENYAQAPNSFFTYTFLPLLKRFDPSYYNLDYYNVPQWLLFEVLGISREGRFGYPNDNLYTALYFGGFQYFSLFFFLMLLTSVHFFIKKSALNWKQTNTASPIQLAIVFSIPLMFSSIQEFIGLLLFYLIFKIFQVLITGFMRFPR
jgi:hypothetical protein